jgi:hypothetical protein
VLDLGQLDRGRIRLTSGDLEAAAIGRIGARERREELVHFTINCQKLAPQRFVLPAHAPVLAC